MRAWLGQWLIRIGMSLATPREAIPVAYGDVLTLVGRECGFDRELDEDYRARLDAWLRNGGADA